MKKNISFLLCLLFASLLIGAAVGNYGERSHPLYAPNKIKVKLSVKASRLAALPSVAYAETSNFSFDELDTLFNQAGGTSVIRAHIKPKDTVWEMQTGFDRWFIVKLDGSKSVDQALDIFSKSPYIEDAIPEYYAYLQLSPNDTYYANNWGHNNTGQLPAYSGGSHSGNGVGTIGFDSDADIAWDHLTNFGSPNIVIAIIDSGADLLHPDLLLVPGYDYGDNDTNPTDNSAEKGHGTSCSGIAAAKANNGIGIAGIGAGCSVMPLKVIDTGGDIEFTYIENALVHAGDNDVNVGSMSFGASMSYGSSPSTDTALAYAYNNGVTLFAATGNNNSSTMSYPANHPNVIAVGAASPTGQRKSYSSSDGENWWGSNYGVNTQDAANAVDVMAPTILPATDISGTIGYSTTDYYMWFNGTSCATPYAAGVAGLMLSRDPTLSPAQLRSILTSTTKDMTIDGGTGWDRYTGYGLVCASYALNAIVLDGPTCTITSPEDGSSFNLGSLISISVAAADSITQVQFFIDDSPTAIHTDTEEPYTYDWDTMDGSLGTHTILAVATDQGGFTAEDEISISLILPADEGFETGDFSAYMWKNTNFIPWYVQNLEQFSETYAARSGAIGLADSTSLSLKLQITAAGNISFYSKTMCLVNRSYLRFYIDGVLQGQWTGVTDWEDHTYPVTAGVREFTWVYSNATALIGEGNCAWLDHITFPPYETFYNPPLSFRAVGGDSMVYLNWLQPEGGNPTGYKLYRDNNILTTVTGLHYFDTGLQNGQLYSYRIAAVYSDGESATSNAVNAVPNADFVPEIQLGIGDSATGYMDGSPINIYNRSLHGQSVYTAEELNLKAIFGHVYITSLGFEIVSVPNLPLTNFMVRLGHTSDVNVINWQSPDSLLTVYTNAAYVPIVGSYQMLQFSIPFLWNGVDNIVVDTSFGLTTNFSNTGSVRRTGLHHYGYRFIRANNLPQAEVFEGGSYVHYRPTVKLSFSVYNPNPEIEVSTTSMSYNGLLFGGELTKNFSITNGGNSTLIGEISTPEGYSVSLAGSQRNTLSYAVAAGTTKVFALKFAPTEPGIYNGEVLITHNSDGETRVITLVGSSFEAIEAPFVEGFESGLNGWVAINGTQTNAWTLGSATRQTGTKAIYISNNAGTTNSYNVNSASVVYFYRDVFIPNGEDIHKLRFGWKCMGEGSGQGFDYLRVYLTEPSVIPEAGQMLSAGQFSPSLYNFSTWQEAEYTIPITMNGQTKRIIFLWKNDNSQGNQPPAAIDNVRIITGGQADYANVINGEVNTVLPSVTNPQNVTIIPSLLITGLNTEAPFITVLTGYNTLNCPFPNAGMDIKLSGVDFSGAHFVFTHNLGYIPSCLAYKVGSAGQWMLYNSIPWTTTSAYFELTDDYENATEISFSFPTYNFYEPPWLTPFTAILNTANKVKLQWVTPFEPGITGFSVWRNQANNLSTATQISPIIPPLTDLRSSYSYTDSLTVANTQYYYWLQVFNIDLMESFHGPVSIETGDDPIIIPVEGTKLLGNYPNPFIAGTKLHYGVAETGVAEFIIYNSRGQIVFTQKVPHAVTGYYDLDFEGQDKHGKRLGSGVYYVKMTLGGKTSARKMLLVK